MGFLITRGIEYHRLIIIRTNITGKYEYNMKSLIVISNVTVTYSNVELMRAYYVYKYVKQQMLCLINFVQYLGNNIGLNLNAF
jgi:hypothetical protein